MKPDFTDRCLELRLDGEEVCIYANKTGLRKLASLCLELAGKVKSGSSEHIHLDDLEIMTKQSKRGVLAVFDDDPEEKP